MLAVLHYCFQGRTGLVTSERDKGCPAGRSGRPRPSSRRWSRPGVRPWWRPAASPAASGPSPGASTPARLYHGYAGVLGNIQGDDTVCWGMGRGFSCKYASQSNFPMPKEAIRIARVFSFFEYHSTLYYCRAIRIARSEHFKRLWSLRNNCKNAH